MPQKQKKSFKISLSEVAKAAGISTSAVSLALRNSPKISEARKLEVRKIAEQLGYVQDPRIAELMQHLRSNRETRLSSVLGVIIPQLKQSEWDKFPPLKVMLKGIREQAEKMGFGVDSIILEDLQTRSERVQGILEARGIKGVIVLPYQKGVGTIDLNVEGFSVVTGGYSIVKPNLNRVVPDYLQMMDEILAQLCELGYRRIGMIMTYTRDGGGNGRKLFLSSLLYYQSLIDPKWVVPFLPNRKATLDGIEDWIYKHSPEVIVSSGHIMGMIEQLGYSVPDDFGFVSIDLSEPPHDVSGVDHRWDSVGREAVKMLATDINNNESGIPEQPRVLMVDSHFRAGSTLQRIDEPIDVRVINTPR